MSVNPSLPQIEGVDALDRVRKWMSQQNQPEWKKQQQMEEADLGS